jgi:UDP-glucose 4-epimerase
MTRPANPRDRVVAVTGACTYLGSELLRRLAEQRRFDRILALDIQDPYLVASGLPKGRVEWVKLDLTQPTIDGDLATLFERERVDTLVHAAFLSRPTHATEWAHELEDVGTMHLLNASAAVPPRRIVMVSTTLIYGAHAKNPNFLTEAADLRGHPDSRFVNDKVRAEMQLLRFAAEHPKTQVCSLRFAPILGPAIDNLHTRFLRRSMAPVMLGHDPVMQFVHELDAAWALLQATVSECRGPLNIVGKGVLPYSTVLAMLGRVPIPMPLPIARYVIKALWATQLVGSPASFLDFLLFPCVADGKRASVELGFVPRFNIQRTILDFLGEPPEDGAIDVASAQG